MDIRAGYRIVDPLKFSESVGSEAVWRTRFGVLLDRATRFVVAFAVYSEGRDTDERGFPLLQNRAFIVKYTKLFRF